MATFAQSFSMTQSSDCTTLSFADTSNFGSNDQGYTYSTFTTKTITLYDSNNNILTTLVITDSTPVTYVIQNDMYIKAVYQLSNMSLTLTPVIQTYTLSCFVELKYGNYLVTSSNTSTMNNAELDKNTQPYFNVVKALKAAEIFGSRAIPVKAQDCLDLANDYIDDLLNN